MGADMLGNGIGMPGMIGGCGICGIPPCMPVPYCGHMFIMAAALTPRGVRQVR